MAELGDVIGGDIVTAAFTNDVKNRSVMRYASASARDASIPTPQDGDVALLQDANSLTIYANGSWLDIGRGLGVPRIRYYGAVSTGPNGEFAVGTGFTPTFAVAQGAQVAFAAAMVLQQMNSSQVIWRAYGLKTNGAEVANTTIDVIYQIWG